MQYFWPHTRSTERRENSLYKSWNVCVCVCQVNKHIRYIIYKSRLEESRPPHSYKPMISLSPQPHVYFICTLCFNWQLKGEHSAVKTAHSYCPRKISVNKSICVGSCHLGKQECLRGFLRLYLVYSCKPNLPNLAGERHETNLRRINTAQLRGLDRRCFFVLFWVF